MWLSKGNLPSGNLFDKNDHIFGWAGIFADKVGKINSIQGIDSLQKSHSHQYDRLLKLLLLKYRH